MTKEVLTGLFFAALALSIERLGYVWIWRNPTSFQRICEASSFAALRVPTDAVRYLFTVFKAIQAAVFLGWLAHFGSWFGDAAPTYITGDRSVLALGLTLIAVGQLLNFSVFYRLGRVGVFYGTRFGHDVPWVRGFPFSLVAHPQYVGTAMSIWGLFLATRFPHPDWAVLPILETLYYIAGAIFERDPKSDLQRELTSPVLQPGSTDEL